MRFRLFKQILTLLIIISASCHATATTPIAGWWRGQVSTLPVVFQIKGPDSDGNFSGNLYSPAQTADSIPLSHVTVAGDTISIRIDQLGVRYHGIYDGKSIHGTFTQGRDFKMTLQQASADDARLYRPQTPRPPFFYNTTDITFKNDTLTFAGTLTAPLAKQPSGAIVLVSGSGAQDRDETILGHKPFAVIADFLTRCGWAVLRYDDRGVGGSSTGSPDDTTLDFATDAMAAIDYLRNRPELRDKPIGILGHSEGGAIAIINAAEHPDQTDFIITLAAPAVKGYELMVRQNEMIAEVVGNAEITPEHHDLLYEAFKAVASDIDNETLNAKLHQLLPPVIQDEKALEASIKQVSTPWYRAFLALDPQPYMNRITCPMLALNGDWDIQVEASQNLTAIEKNVPSAKTIVYPGLNHMFQESGSRKASTSYGSISQTISPAVLSDIADFLTEITRR